MAPVRLAAPIALAICLGAASPAGAQWRRIDSPNFVVIGEVGEGELRGVAKTFEAFRETLGRVLTERAISTAVPTVVIVFPHQRAFTPFWKTVKGKPIEAAGVFVGGPDVNYIAIQGDSQLWQQIVFHEYAHVVVANIGRRMPIWVDEGLAEYYSMFELLKDGREARLGLVSPDRLAVLQQATLLPLETLLTVDYNSPLYNESNRRNTFYLQSWALTHLIIHGEIDRTPQLNAYLEHLSNGLTPKQAWEKAFGPKDIIRELDLYIRRRALSGSRYVFPERLATFDAPVTKMSPAEVEAFLAEFLIQEGRLEEASEWLRTAQKHDSANMRSKLVAASLEIKKKDHAAGATRLRAIGPPTDWLSAYQAGAAVSALARLDAGRTPPDWLEAARRYFGAARADRPEYPNALARIAELELRTLPGPSAATRQAIERARELAPGRHDYELIYAQVLARESHFAEARQVLEPLLSNQYPEYRDSAQRVMTRVLEMENAKLAGAGVRPAAPVVSLPAEPTRSDDPPPRVIRPIYRELQAGEERVEGILGGIECPAGRPVFQLKTPTGVMTFTAARLSAVELSTHRPEFIGGVDCGPFKEPVAVYLTWRPASDGSGARVAVAIEVLPKDPVRPAAISSEPTSSAAFPGRGTAIRPNTERHPHRVQAW
jgi:tetratricopeptide (TPR) repeat protein